MKKLTILLACLTLAAIWELAAILAQSSYSPGQMLQSVVTQTLGEAPLWVGSVVGAALTAVLLATALTVVVRVVKTLQNRNRRGGKMHPPVKPALHQPAGHDAAEGSSLHAWLRLPARVVYWMLAPVMWLIYLPVLPLLVFAISAQKNGAVRFVSFSRLVYVWPLCMVGYVLWPLHEYGFIGDMPALMIRDVVVALVIFTLAINIRLTDAVIICLVTGVATLGDIVFWMSTGHSVWQQVFGYYLSASAGHEYPADLMFRLSHFWGLIFAAEYITALVSRRYAITFNDVRKYKLIGFDRIAGATRRLRFEYHGLMDYALLLAGGSVELLNARNVPYHRINNVAMLFLYQNEIERRLGETKVRDDHDEEDAEFLEDEDLSDEETLE